MSSLSQAEQYLVKGEYRLAEQTFTELTHNRPSSKETGYAFMGLGQLALMAKKGDAAVEHLSHACEFLSGEIKPLCLLADAFNMVNAHEDALTVLNYANQVVPESATLRYQLAQQQILMGESEQAKAHLKLAIEQLSQRYLDATDLFSIEALSLFANCLLSFSCLQKVQFDRQQVAPLTCQSANAHFDSQIQTQTYALLELCDKNYRQHSSVDGIKVRLHYALANQFHRQTHYAQALTHYKQANRSQFEQCKVTTSELTAYFDLIKAFAGPDALAIQSDQTFDVTPIFILGLPNSGASRLEQMLCAHPQVDSAGECSYLADDVLTTAYKLTAKHYPRSLSDLSTEQLNHLAEHYLNRLKQFVNPEFDANALSHSNQRFHPEVTHIIDRLPANFQSIGLIYKLFPHAKVINVRREANAVKWAVYQRCFAGNQPYFCSLTEFEHYQHAYNSLMAHWDKTLPGVVFDLHGERLISEAEKQLSTLLCFCQLPEDESVITHSAVQSQGIAGDQGWQHYQKLISGKM
ncbi:tetratricopeptide repeat-containing sulfotransferase family protein [Shewanella colwelliana]|uniref:tetratricopeptide repeat-containing sulfotransferase family protein n=1 Tax=Shewanella colwelliana TaxID=23 RepID=UPI003D041589